MVLLPQWENKMKFAPHAATPVYQSTTKNGSFSNISDLSGVSFPHGWDVRVILNIYQTHLCQFFLIWRSQGFPSHSLPFLSRTSVTSFQQVLLEAATHVIEDLIFSLDLPIPDSQIPLCPFLCNAEIALSHVFLTPEKSGVRQCRHRLVWRQKGNFNQLSVLLPFASDQNVRLHRCDIQRMKSWLLMAQQP